MGLRRARSRSGFTLIELMVAMTILGMSLALVLEVISAGTNLGHDVHRRTEAILLARWKMNQLQIEGFPSLGRREGAFEEPFDGYAWTTEVTSTDDENLRDLSLRVDWMEGRVEKELELSTLLYNYGERRKGLFF